MDTRTKVCPACKQQIPADAAFCSYCGARFAVTFQGYCANCHTIRDLNAASRCSICGGEVIDQQPRSQYLEDGKGLVVNDPTPPRSNQTNEIPSSGKASTGTLKDEKIKGSTGCLGWARGCLVLTIIGLGILLAGYYLSGDFRQKLRDLGGKDIVGTESTRTAGIANTAVASQTLPENTDTPHPTTPPKIDLPAIPADSVCVGAYAYGLSCLSDGTWTSLPAEELPLTGHISDLAVCGGKFFLNISDVLYSFVDGKWTKYGEYGGKGSATIGCRVQDADISNDVWLFEDEAAYHQDGAAWTEYMYETVLNGTGYLTIQDVVVMSDHQVWVAANENVVHYDGTSWTVYENKKDLNTDYQLSALAVDSKGVPWVAFQDGLAFYNGSSWTKIAPPASSDVNTVYVDPTDQVWVGTDGGVSMYQNGGWKRYPIGKQAGGVLNLAMDGLQRMWVGTDWGLGILENGQYTFYHMANSDLLMNYIQNLIVLGNGSSLPQKTEKQPGSMRGRLVDGTNPLKNMRVEICVQSLGVFYSGATPCSSQPYFATTTSDSDGNFTIKDIPPGYYVVTFQVPDGGWKVRSDIIRIGSIFIPVRSGDETSLGELDISK